ncbi:hypothetical protein Goshw_015511 [Gossypium schwendimanii]|uniref:Uncharacterized protein n=1 Tax=Gossypium schwendimanii TaxID=34291 RepID=A0A7J9LN11_GOSSC|nr:hypothetical protein [Gossypium schwendimanii]
MQNVHGCRFRAITSSYYRGALGALLVYDITRRTTFQNVKKWIHELREFGNLEMVIVLVGNKSDLSESRQVSEEEGKKIAEMEGLFFMETSALRNLNVEEAFLRMINKIHETTMSQKCLDVNMKESNVVGAGKEIITIDEVTATKHSNNCCYR